MNKNRGIYDLGHTVGIDPRPQATCCRAKQIAILDGDFDLLLRKDPIGRAESELPRTSLLCRELQNEQYLQLQLP